MKTLVDIAHRLLPGVSSGKCVVHEGHSPQCELLQAAARLAIEECVKELNAERDRLLADGPGDEAFASVHGLTNGAYHLARAFGLAKEPI